MTTRARHDLRAFAAAAQGLLYVVTGLWPLIHLPSFEAVSGPKASDWLVRTVGVLILVVGVVLLMAWRRRRFPAEVVTLAVGCALSLAAIDIIYVSVDRIREIYLLDAAAEIALAAAWLAAAYRHRRDRHDHHTSAT